MINIMRLIQLSDIAADPELSACLVAMQELPGAWLRSCDVVGEEACFFINETGGSIRICPYCNELDSPNRPCGCWFIEEPTQAKEMPVVFTFEDLVLAPRVVRLRRRSQQVARTLVQEGLDEYLESLAERGT